MKTISNAIIFGKKCIKKGLIIVTHPNIVTTKVDYFLQRRKDDILAREGHYPYPHHIIFLAGMALGGTTWMKNILARIPGYYTRRTPMPWTVSYNGNFCDSAFRYTSKYGYTLFKTHLEPTQDNLDCITRNGVTKIIITYRDFRDVALSRCHRLMQFPKPKEAPDFVDYEKLGFEKALEHSIQVVADSYTVWIRGWVKMAEKEPDRYCFVTFEEMKADTKKSYKKVLEFYEINLHEELIDANIEAAKGKGKVKDNIVNSEVLPWGLSSNFRSGKIGGWQQEFSQASKALAKEKLGAALIEFGYEKDLNW